MANRREVPCEVCGLLGPVKYPLSRRQLCLEHAVARAIEHARQMHERSGPDWERWLAAYQAAISRTAAGRAAAVSRAARRAPGAAGGPS